jgi:hypothetical protein
MKLPMVPFVKTTCSNSRINFVSSHPLQIDTQMGLSLTADGRVAITDPQVAFSLEESNYRVEGPDSCSGSFSVTDYVSKYVLNRLFNNARGVIQDALKDEITKILPRIAGLINQQLASTYPLQLPHMVLLPRLDSGLKLSPTELSISAEHLVARAGVRVVPSPQAKSLVRSPILEQAPRVMARFGVNLELVNHLLQQVVAQKKTELHLSPHLHEVFSSLLKVEELKTIWPELVTKPREHELMQLFVSLAEAPRVSFKKDADMDLLHVELPDLLLRWQTRSKGAWQNFFFVHTHLSGDLSVRVVEGNLALDFKNFHSELRGSWAEGYQPRQEFFDAELFKEVLEIILHTARSSLGKTVFPLPAVVFAGEKMALDSVMLAAPFAHFSVLGNN